MLCSVFAIIHIFQDLRVVVVVYPVQLTHENPQWRTGVPKGFQGSPPPRSCPRRVSEAGGFPPGGPLAGAGGLQAGSGWTFSRRSSHLGEDTAFDPGLAAQSFPKLCLQTRRVKFPDLMDL